MRVRGRVDRNHAEIVAAFRKAGWSVVSLSAVGNGCPDLLVVHPAVDELRLVEVKARKGRLTAEQVKFHREFPVSIVRSVEDVVAIVEQEQ